MIHSVYSQLIGADRSTAGFGWNGWKWVDLDWSEGRPRDILIFSWSTSHKMYWVPLYNRTPFIKGLYTIYNQLDIL